MSPKNSFLARIAGTGAFLLALALPSTAAAYCEMVGAVTVTSGQVQPRLDSRATAAEITERAEQVRPGFADGITFVRFQHEITLQPRPYVNGCRVVNVTVRLFAQRSDIYIAKELSPDSCRWQAVMEHELRHLQIAQKSLDLGANLLRDALSNPPERFQSFDADFSNGRSVRSWVAARAVQAVRKVSEASHAGDVALDTDHEGRRLEAQCGGPPPMSINYRSARLQESSAKHLARAERR